MTTTQDRNCISTWLPVLERAGLPVPRTVLVDAGKGWRSLVQVLEGEQVPLFAEVCARIRTAARHLGGYPVFLRTGQGSGKHQWNRCCHVPDEEAVPERVANLIEWSETVDFLGLSCRIWAVRELLPTEPVATLSRCAGMPLVKEVRCFIEDGKVLCMHPYWPPGAIREGLHDPDTLPCILPALELTEADRTEVSALAQQVAAAFAGDGSWSVDLLQTRDGWYVTDMAEAERSFHWPGCPVAQQVQPG